MRAVGTVIVSETPSFGFRASIDISIDVLVLGDRASCSGPPAVRVSGHIIAVSVDASVSTESANRNVRHRGPVNGVVKVLELLGLVHAIGGGSFPDSRPFGLVEGEGGWLVIGTLGSNVVGGSLSDARDGNVGRVDRAVKVSPVLDTVSSLAKENRDSD